MKLFIKNKIMTIGGGSFVVDENDVQKYKVKGKWLSPTKKKKIYDMEGNLLYIVRNKYWHFLKRVCFIYNSEKEKIMQLGYKKLSFRNDFFVEGYKDEIAFKGKLFQFPNINMQIEKNGETIGTLVKDFTFVRDAYTLDIEKEDDAALFVAFTIAIDNIFDVRRGNNKR